MVRASDIRDWMVLFAIVTAAYIAAFAVTFGLFMPIQRNFLPDYANHASILFLPHGVRVLTAWLYGWRALFLLGPGALLTHAYLYGVAGFASDYFFAALFGVFCATFSFWLFAKLGMDFRQRKGQAQLASWREILIAGGFASAVNVIGTGLFYGFDAQSASAYFVGDVGGLIAAMFLLMMAFRWQRANR